MSAAQWMLGLSNASNRQPLHRLFEAADAAGFDDLEASFEPFWMRIQTEARSFVQTESLLASNCRGFHTFTTW